MVINIRYLVEKIFSPAINGKSNLVRGALAALLLAIIGFFAQYLYNVFLARILNTTDYGDFALVTSTAHFLGIILLMGNDDSSVKFLPLYLDESGWSQAKSLLNYYRRHLWVITLSIFGLGLVIHYLSARGYIPEEKNHIVWEYLWIAPFAALLTFVSTLLRSFKRPKISLMLYVISPPLLTIVCILVFKHLGLPLSLRMAIWAYCFAYVFIVLVELILVKQALPPNLVTAARAPAKTRAWFMAGIQLLFTGLIFTCFQSVVSIILKLSWKNSHAVAMFTAVYTVSGLMWISSMACSSMIAPHISPAASENNIPKLQKLYTLGSTLMAGFAAIVFIAFIFFGDFFLGHFGPQYVAEGYWPLMIICTGNLLSMLFGGMCFSFLEYSVDPGLLMRITLIITIAACILGTILCHFFGLFGAAYFVGLTEASFGLVYGWLIHRKFGILPFRFA